MHSVYSFVGGSSESSTMGFSFPLSQAMTASDVYLYQDEGNSNFDKINNSLLYLSTMLGLSDVLFKESYLIMIASERILMKDWDTDEEDTAWASL